MIVTTNSPQPDGDTVVVDAGNGLYRILTENSAPSQLPLIGWIQSIGDGLFEVTALGDPLCRSYWGTLERAVTELRSAHARAQAATNFAAMPPLGAVA